MRSANLSAAGESFSIQSRKVLDPGWTQAMPWAAVSDEEGTLDQYKKGSKLGVKKVELVDRQTTAPGYLTESELITLMEKYGIGTDASIPVHVTNISTRNYVEIGPQSDAHSHQAGGVLAGIALIHGFQRVDAELILPTMRSEVENQLNLIAMGKAEFETVTNHVLNIFRLKFQFFVTNIQAMDELFEASFTSLADSGKPPALNASTAPHCGDTWNLPGGRDCQVRLHGERLCPLDNFELLYLHTIGGKLSKSFAFCPYCFNSPPFESMRKGDGCNNCVHPSCPNSSITQGVAMCLNSCSNETGVLVLDPQSGPKWRLSCNRDCGALHVSAEYKEGKSKLPDGATTYSGCIFCDHEQGKIGDEVLNLKHAHLSKDPVLGGGRRGRGGRGRGRGGSRGRGRGGRP
ncbi:DNA topoisomerase [Aphelenchoides fujianensis]|nr:DNA topoisomerase [Aphelenchoides fujianensis]